GRRALERMGVKLLGVLPRRPLLESKSLLQVFEGIGAQPLNSSPRLGMRVLKTLVGALTTHHAMDHFEDDALLITGGDRTDLLVAATVSKHVTREGRGIAGVIVTRGLRPPDSVMALLTKAEIPVALVRSDTYNTARRVHELESKMAPNDKAKHDLALELIEQNMD